MCVVRSNSSVRQRGLAVQRVDCLIRVGQHFAVVGDQELVAPIFLAQIGLQARGEDRGLLVVGAFLIPVRRLHADEHAEHDDRQVDDDGSPMLVLDVLDDAAQFHGWVFPASDGYAMVGGGGQCNPDSANRALKWGVASRSNGAPHWHSVTSIASSKPPAGRASNTAACRFASARSPESDASTASAMAQIFNLEWLRSTSRKRACRLAGFSPEARPTISCAT